MVGTVASGESERLRPRLALDEPVQRRRRWRLSRKFAVALTLVTILVGLALGRLVFREQIGIRAVKSLGCSVRQDTEWFPVPRWLARAFKRAGVSDLSHPGEVLAVSLNGTDSVDSDLAVLAYFPAMKGLDLGRTKISDLGIESLCGNEGLRRLDL